MHRRAFLAATGIASLGGCSRAAELAPIGSSGLSIGETAEFGELVITATDVMTAQKMEVWVTDSSGEQITAPSNGRFGFFHIEVKNTDITEQEAPSVNTNNYDTLQIPDDTISTVGPNDIRIFSGNEGGHLPEDNQMLAYQGLSVNDANLGTYPAGPTDTGPRVGPNDSIDGWVFAVVPKEGDLSVKLVFEGDSQAWAAGDEPLDTPTSGGGEISI